MALFDLNRAQDTPVATLKLAEIAPKNWHRFPPAQPSSAPAYVAAVSYAWPYNGISGDDVNVATANATGAYEPKNQGNKSNMLGAQHRWPPTSPSRVAGSARRNPTRPRRRRRCLRSTRPPASAPRPPTS